MIKDVLEEPLSESEWVSDEGYGVVGLCWGSGVRWCGTGRRRWMIHWSVVAELDGQSPPETVAAGVFGRHRVRSNSVNLR